MDNLYWLDQIQLADRLVVGDIAFDLSQLLQRHYPVVPGFVISSQLWCEFLETLNRADSLLADLPHSSLYLDVNNPRQLQQVSQHLRQEIITATLPPSWVSSFLAAAAVWQTPGLIFRPSLALPADYIVPISGLLEPQICLASPESITSCLKGVWAELFRARSLFYWQRLGIQLPEIHLAVLVQPLSNAIASGTLSSARDTFPWQIQATWGLGKAISQGEVIPDCYQCSNSLDSVPTQHLGRKTRAYRLKAPLASRKTDASCVESYLISQQDQKQYALEDKFLNTLLHLGQQLKNELSLAFTWEWTVSQIETDSEPHLYLTQVTYQPDSLEIQPQNIYQKILPKVAEKQYFSTIQTPSTQFIVQGLPGSSGRVIASAQVISSSRPNFEEIKPGTVLVAQSISPDWLPLMKQAVGVVAEQGGMTCHAAILARELGIPAIVGATNATQLIKTGESILVDGSQGIIFRVPLQKNLSLKAENFKVKTSYFSSSVDPITTQLLVNLSQLSTIERVASLPIDGVGLLRSELLFLEILEGKHPHQWLRQGQKQLLIERLSHLIQKFTDAFSSRPVFYRSLDLRSHEFQSLENNLPDSILLPRETNPMLGLRGTFSYQTNPELFDLELSVLSQVRQAGHTNIHLILPFVRTVEEFSFCQRRIEQAGLTQQSNFQIWIMAEVPSVLFLLPDYVKAGVQGISIGTNDLTQLLLGVDRDQKQMALAFNERHPAVMRAIKQLIQLAFQLGIPCSICGQATAQFPDIIESLVRWGITSISVEPDALEQTYTAISHAEKRFCLESIRQRIKQ